WDDYKSINSAIKDEKNRFLNLENKINNQIIVIDGVIDELDSLKNSEVYDLFYLRHLPFWKKSIKKSTSNTTEKVGVESISENLSSTISYVKSLGNTIYLFLTTLILMILGLFLIKNSFLKYPLADPNKNLLKAKEIIVNKTTWGMLFLTLVLLRLFFPNTPKLFYDVLVLFMLVCATALVRPYLHMKFKNIPYFFILILFLDLAKTYIWLSSFEYRLYLLFEASLILGILMYFTYSFRKTRDLKSADSILIRVIPFVYILVIASLISNILGYTNLTDFIIKLCIQGGDLTLIFYAIFLMLNTILLGFIHYHFNTSSKDFNIDQKIVINLKLQRYIKVFTLLLWLFYFLNLFDIYRPLTEIILDIFSEPYKVGDITFTLGMIFMFVTILTVSYLITSIISFLLDGNELKIFFINLPKGIPAAISLVIRYFILAFGFVLALSVLGIDLSKFNVLAGALGLGIGFGLQTIVSNFISGIILIFERPILTGDVVEVNNLIGTVSKIGVRASRISTYEGAEVVVPNNNLISKDLINWTLSDNIKRVEILIGVAYDSDPSDVLKVLEKVANENEKVLKNPPSVALFDKFGDSTLEFRLLFWVYFQNGLQVKSDVSIAIHKKFKELGIKIPFPQREIHVSQEEDLSIKPFDK
ncbi:MAG: mechanosensitive ion channel, partial [Bacteroidetes bacterium]|nr:mechanosensitive ion channel [Bacteroidota bacterium]